MSISISDLFHQFPEKTVPTKLAAENVTHFQHDFYFTLAVLKSSRQEKQRKYFSVANVKKLFIGANLSGFSFKHDGLEIEYLQKGFFHEDNQEQLKQKQTSLENSIVIINNNDVGHQGDRSYYASFYLSCEKTIFIVWDWDNHHWLELSTFLAAHSDIYAPSHHENLYQLSRFNWLIAGPVYCATVQWPHHTLLDNLHQILSLSRSESPLGMHIPYAPFRFRNQVITTIHQHYSNVGFSDRTFHGRTPEDRLHEWCSHKSHWIVPVLNDVPIRIFDALVTGGIPIVPDSLRLLPPVSEIDTNHIVFYSPQDIVEPRNIVARANALFDEGGTEKLLERHNYALNNHHGINRINQILHYVNKIFDLNLLRG